MKITDKYVFFVGSCFSNWYPCKFKMKLIKDSEEIEFNCSEQAFIASKALVFNDFYHVDKIMSSSDPAEQKAFGRQVRNFDANKWNEVAPKKMYWAVVNKFNQNPDLKKELFDLGISRNFVEAAWYDNIWGVGLRETDPLIDDPKKLER